MNNISRNVQKWANNARHAFPNVPTSAKLGALAAGIGIAPIATLGIFLGYETIGLVKEAKTPLTTSTSKISFATRLAGTASLTIGTFLFTGLKLGFLAESAFFQASAVLTTMFGLLTLVTEKVIRSVKTWLSLRTIAKEVKTEEDKTALRQAIAELPENLASKLTSKLSKKGVVI
ncbi:MAG: hypothetical protein ACPL4K_04760 [Candidatus Margulisiibacteriota bacterium]